MVEIRENIGHHMAEVHRSVDIASRRYFEEKRRVSMERKAIEAEGGKGAGAAA